MRNRALLDAKSGARSVRGRPRARMLAPVHDVWYTETDRTTDQRCHGAGRPRTPPAAQ